MIKRFWHFFGYHDYFVIKYYSYCERKVGCRICNKKWGMHDGVKAFLEWDSDLEKLYERNLDESYPIPDEILHKWEGPTTMDC